MKHQGKTVQPGVTFLMKDDPNKVRYTVETVYDNRTLDYTTESAFLKKRRGEAHRAVSKKASFGNFINHVFGEWVESVDEKENAERIALAKVRSLQTEINGVYDEAFVMDAVFDAAHGKDTNDAVLRILDLLAITADAARKEGYDDGYDDGYDNGYNTCLDITPED